jgi:hypothetical protein
MTKIRVNINGAMKLDFFFLRFFLPLLPIIVISLSFTPPQAAQILRQT